MDKKKLEQLSADAHLWETRQLGNSAQHIRVVAENEERAIDDALGLQLISIRLNKALIEQLKALAQLEGMGYQPLIRQVLTKYATDNEHKLGELLSVSEAMERAEELLAQSIQCKELVSTLAPLSNDRMKAECDYANFLANANALFGQVYEQCTDPVLKKHVKLRLEQIKLLCHEESKTSREKRKAV